MKKFGKRGFTFVDLILVMGVTAILYSFSSVALLKVQNKPRLDAVVSKLVADIKLEQSQAMIGDSGSGTETTTWGLYLEQGQYTLFRGASYSAGNSSNLVINLDSSMRISTTFSDGSVIFVRRSGEINNFNSSANTITVTNTASGESTIITVNRYGVLTIT